MDVARNEPSKLKNAAGQSVFFEIWPIRQTGLHLLNNIEKLGENTMNEIVKTREKDWFEKALKLYIDKKPFKFVDDAKLELIEDDLKSAVSLMWSAKSKHSVSFKSPGGMNLKLVLKKTYNKTLCFIRYPSPNLKLAWFWLMCHLNDVLQKRDHGERNGTIRETIYFSENKLQFCENSN